MSDKKQEKKGVWKAFTLAELIIGGAFVFVFAVVITIVVPVWGVKWWLLFVFICISLYVSTPKALRSHSVFGKILALPNLVWQMLQNILKIDHKSTDFLHTTHDK